MRKKAFLTNVASLSLSMLIIQSTSMGFSVYISSILGPEQMGLFHLVMSIYGFCVTVSLSGVPFSATRLTAEEAHIEKRKYIISRCLALSLMYSFVCALFLTVFSRKIATYILHNETAHLYLKILGVSLPFLSASLVFRGYFTGTQKTGQITICAMAEEFSSIFIMLLLLKNPHTKATGSLVPVIATCVSSVVAFVTGGVLYVLSTGKRTAKKSKNTLSSILSISIPVAFGSYLRSGLGATENLIIPSALSRFGSTNSLRDYGTVKAMAMPIITFPYVFLQSFTSLLVPEISSRQAKHKSPGVLNASLKSLKYTAVFSVLVGGVFFFFGKRLSLVFYGSLEAGVYITALSLLAVPMYIDTVTDSLLKGLNQQVYCLKINIIDAVCRVVIIYFLLPHTGICGYIAVLYISEGINLTMSAMRLKKVLA